MRRVRRVATFLIVQGCLELSVGLLFAGFALYARIALGGRGLAEGLLPAELMGILIVLGPGLLGTGSLKVFAGLRNYRYRGRRLGIVALASGALSLFACYCAPTAIALLVYGLSVYADTEVERAFVMGEEGLSPEWIQASMGQRAPARSRPFGV